MLYRNGIQKSLEEDIFLFYTLILPTSHAKCFTCNFSIGKYHSNQFLVPYKFLKSNKQLAIRAPRYNRAYYCTDPEVDEHARMYTHAQTLAYRTISATEDGL